MFLFIAFLPIVRWWLKACTVDGVKYQRVIRGCVKALLVVLEELFGFFNVAMEYIPVEAEAQKSVKGLHLRKEP